MIQYERWRLITLAAIAYLFLALPIVRGSTGLISVAEMRQKTHPSPPPPQATRRGFEFCIVSDGPAADSEPLRVARSGALIYVRRTPILEQNTVKSAYVTHDSSGKPAVVIVFNDLGRERLAAMTRANIGKNMAIVFDRIIVTTITINGEIADGRAIVSGVSQQFASDLAALVNQEVSRSRPIK